MSALNREEILILLRQHVGSLASMLQSQNTVPKNVLLNGGGPENRGGLNRINELFEILQDPPRSAGSDGE